MALPWRHQRHGSVPHKDNYTAPKGRGSPEAAGFSQSVGPQWLYPVLGSPSPGDAEALASAFPG